MTPIFARTLYSSLIFFHQSRKVGVSGAMPLPTIATSRPPGCKRLRACSTCCAPIAVSRLPWIRPAVAEKGGFITTTVGLTVCGRIAFKCSAFSV